MYAYTYENGRRYHAFRAGTYPLPNDEDEQDRLDLAHHIFKLILGGNLYRAPIKGTPQHPRPSPQRILDVATGTGIWAIEMADDFPEATVIGTDLSPIQPGWLPPNCRFYVDDVESEWAFGEREGLFDYIHSRALAGSIGDWANLYKQVGTPFGPSLSSSLSSRGLNADGVHGRADVSKSETGWVGRVTRVQL